MLYQQFIHPKPLMEQAILFFAVPSVNCLNQFGIDAVLLILYPPAFGVPSFVFHAAFLSFDMIRL